jgi:catalase
VQPRALYRDVMNDTDRDHLVSNIVAHASANVTDPIQRRVVQYWTNVDPQLGARVAAGLGHGNGSGNGVAATSPSQQEAAR